MEPQKRHDYGFDINNWALGIFLSLDNEFFGVTFGPFVYSFHWKVK